MSETEVDIGNDDTVILQSEIKLDIGCGKICRPGWIGIDKITGGDAETLTLPNGEKIPDNSVSEIYASHVLEHLPRWAGRRALKRWCAALKPGGRIRVAVPDMRKICTAYLQGRPVNIDGLMYGGQTDEWDYHKSGYDDISLGALLEHFGLEKVRRFEHDQDDCAKLPISLNMEGVKRERPELDRYPVTTLHKIMWVQSMPRIGFVAPAFCMMQMVRATDIPCTGAFGVNWGQCLEREIEKMIKRGAEWILVTDYDSVYSPSHLVTLWNIINATGDFNEIDAIAPIEFKREEHSLIAGFTDDDGNRVTHVRSEILNQEKVRVDWAHFGLTLIRTEAIQRMSKPWFKETPGPDGGWNDGHIDNDIGFWNNFREHGGKIFVSPRVAIGHNQQVSVWPDQEIQPLYQYLGDWERNGMPVNAKR